MKYEKGGGGGTSSVKVTSVTVYPKSVTIQVGEWYAAGVITCPSNATNWRVTWSSSDTTVATVNASSGYIYGQGVGTATITARAADGSGRSDSLTVTVTSKAVPVSMITLDRGNLILEKGESVYVTATVCPYNATNPSVSWRSSNSKVATVSGGTVHAVGKGTATITVSANDGSGVSTSIQVTVTEEVLVSSVVVIPQCLTMTAGKTAYLRTSVLPADATDRSVKWSSTNSTVATVNADSGMILARSPGTTIIYATAQDGSGKRGACDLTVLGTVCVDSVTLSSSALTLYKNTITKLSATVEPSNATNKTLRWSSSAPDIVSVSDSGEISTHAAGTATIIAAAQDGSGASACCRITVLQTVTEPEPEEPESTVDGSTVADPVDAYRGAHTLKNQVMTLYGGQGLSLVLQYDSARLSAGVFGIGWYHNYEKRLEIEGETAKVYSSPSVYSEYAADAARASFTCTSANKNGYVLTVDASKSLPYQINCNFERTEYYGADGKLAKIKDHQGFETQISESNGVVTITDAVSGKKICLEKNPDGRICRVYDDAQRQATFTYQGSFLTGICDLDGNRLAYTYDEAGRIKTGTDSGGVCYFSNAYDEFGRVISQRDGIAGSRPTLFSYESGGRRVITDRNGKQSVRVFDGNGLLVSHTDENGNTKTYAYDGRYNVIRETDAKGNSVVKTYNAFHKPTEIVDKNGNKTEITYDSAGNVTRIRYPETGGVRPEEIFVYNARNQLTQHTDLRGTVTVYTYDAAAMPASKKVGSRNAVQYSYQNGLLVSQTDAMGNTTQYGHNAAGQVTSKTDAENHVTIYEYDACGNLLKATDACGKTVTTVYDGNHQKTSVTDACGNKTEYTYNGNMKNDTVTLPDGNRITYAFDGEDRTVSMTDQAGNLTTIQYDDGGRVVSKTFADGGTWQYEYDAAGNVVKETGPEGAVTRKTYDAAGNVLSVTDNEGNQTSYQYNAMSKVVRAVNAMSGATEYAYSAAGDLLSETDALGHTKTYTYDAFGELLTATDARGNTTAYTYDANGNLLTVKDAENHVTTYTYNSLNQLVSVKDAKNNVTRYGYDALGRRTTVTDAKNHVFTTEYDGNGNVVKTKDAKGNTVSETVYNSLNLPASVKDAAGQTTRYTYNALGKAATMTDAQNHVTAYEYDARGRNTSVTDASGGISRAEYDTQGHVTKRKGPLGGSTSYGYDAMGRLITETTASGGTVSYGYNELNVKSQRKNARGQQRKYFYDAAGRLTGYTCPEGAVSYTYDAAGNVLTVTDGNGTASREYDALNRVTKYTDTKGKTVRYEYDAVGCLVKMIYPDNTAVQYGYDATGRLTSVTDWQGRVTSYTYDANGRVTNVTKPDGSVTATAYDSAQRVISHVERSAAGWVIVGYEYTYDTLGRISEEKDLAKNTKVCYTYDSLTRVTGRTVKTLEDVLVGEESYEYDAAGNITSAAEDSYVYDTNNRLTSAGGNAIAYDMDGNMTSGPLGGTTAAFAYDSGNRLIKAGDCAYTYDAEDLRIKSEEGGTQTEYTYNPQAKLSQLLMRTKDGAVTKYVYGLGLIGEESGGEFRTYHFDSRGSTVAVTGGMGDVTNTFAYDAYGRLTEKVGMDDILFCYNGKYGVITEPSGLVYMRARYYSPELRRFINADVVAGEILECDHAEPVRLRERQPDLQC